jgi:hypothetical protein
MEPAERLHSNICPSANSGHDRHRATVALVASRQPARSPAEGSCRLPCYPDDSRTPAPFTWFALEAGVSGHRPTHPSFANCVPPGRVVPGRQRHRVGRVYASTEAIVSEVPPCRANEAPTVIARDACALVKAQLGVRIDDVQARATFRTGKLCASFPVWKISRRVRSRPPRPERSYGPLARHTTHRLVVRSSQLGSSSQ